MPGTDVSPASTAAAPRDLLDLLGALGTDPSRLVFHDELTDLRNRRYLKSYFEHRVRWRTGEDYPISLLVLDIDHFKRVNDTRGHDVGDRALTWMAELLSESAGPDGIPVRYAGDEFVVLLPGTTRPEALRIAEGLVAASRTRPLRLESGEPLRLTISVGVASAPDDATDARALFQAADQALYQAKQSGRDRAASAAEVDAGCVFPRAALHHIREAGLCGREDELLAVSRGLDALRRGRSGFLLFDGATGMGKTALLDAVAGKIADDGPYRVARGAGDAREGFQPYYLARGLLASLLRRAGEKAALEGLDETTRKRLAFVMPGLAGPASEGPADESDRRGIADALIRAFAAAAGGHPLVLLVDDAHLADGASLRLLRGLHDDDIPALVAGCALDPPRGLDDPPTPLETFLDAAGAEIGVRRSRLRSLAGEDVELHLQRLFPGLRMPLGFAEEVARATDGNPLFVGELIRELVADRKIGIRDSRWTAERLDPGYLPRSLDEVLRRRIASLPREDRDLLERAAAIGEGTSLSVLVGSSDQDEGRVLDFVDRAEAAGLVRVEFEGDEEVVRFLGKRVQEVSYEAIDEKRRTELHEEIGTYGEALYERSALPSASMPAWQFQRAGNEAKATRFRDLQKAESMRVFDPEDALDGIGELVETETETEAPLDPDSVSLLSPLIRAFTKAVRDVQLYPAESQAVVRSSTSLCEAVEAILADNPRLHLSRSRGALLANGRRPPLPDGPSLTNAFVELLDASELQGVTFLRGVDEAEIRVLVQRMGTLRQNVVPAGFWSDVAREEGFSHVRLEQVKYTQVVKRRVAGAPRRPVFDDGDLDPDAWKRLPRVLRALQGASRTARLYAVDAPATAVAVDRLHEALDEVTGSGRAVTFADVDGALLVNGRRAEISGAGELGDEIAGLLADSGIRSVSFLPDAPREEIEAFVGALRDVPDEVDGDHWTTLGEELGLGFVVFDARRFATPSPSAVLAVHEAVEDEPRTVDPVLEEAERRAAESGAAIVQTLPALGRQLLNKGEPALLGQLVRRALEGYESQEPMARELALQACESLFESLSLGLQHEFSSLAAEPLLNALAEEADPSVMEVLGRLLQSVVGVGVQLGDGPLACRVLEALEARRRALAWDPSDARSRLLDRPLKPAVRSVLVDGLRSPEPESRREAARVIGSMGPTRIPLLVEVVLSTPDLRIRQTAATLLAEIGSLAAREFARALTNETVAERRLRMLEVADTVSPDARDLLRDALADGDARIRAAGLALFERLRRDDLVEVVLPLAWSEDLETAEAAIGSLAAVGSPTATEALLTLSASASRPEIRVAGCRALGRVGGAASVEALVDVLEKKRLGLFGPRWPEPVRAAAAAVLREIDHPGAAPALAAFEDDPHRSVREIARGSNGAGTGEPSAGGAARAASPPASS